MASPLYSAFAMEKTPEDDQGVVSSLMNISWTVGWVVGPLISGWVQGSIGFSPLFIVTTILYMSSSLLVWRFFHGTDRKPAGELEPSAM
jgi:MFS family permease